MGIDERKIELSDGFWQYNTFKIYKRSPKKSENKLGKYLLKRKRNGRL